MARGSRSKKSGKRKFQETRNENDTSTSTESVAKKVAVNTKGCKWKDEFGVILENKYGVQFSEDFFHFYEFCQTSKSNPLEVLKLQLCGPYDILNGKIDKNTSMERIELHMHGRFYYDIPEVMTVLFNDDGFHISYFRDKPSDEMLFLVSNNPSESGEYNFAGDNIFAAIYLYCKKEVKRNSSTSEEMKDILNYIESYSKQFGYSLEQISPRLKTRNKNIVTKCFHGAGLVIQLDATGVGYRELPSTNRELKKVLSKVTNADSEETRNEHLDKIQEIITLVQFANDECDYGMGYELGIDLFTFGGDVFHGMILHLLTLAYQFLERDLYGEILEKHLELRRNDNKPINMIKNKND